ncbi:hypothetical protein [Nocardia sp. NPDC048505]|uniref:hypothetical protein n=1 Tax=unclassified Nocardia TaxID=2637762 RepID=UPI0033CD446A
MNLFGWARRRGGRLPEKLREELGGARVLVEQLAGTLTLRDYRAPRRYTSWSKETIAGAVAVTEDRLVVWAQGRSVLDVPRTGAERDEIEVLLEDSETVCFGFEVGRFHEGRSGRGAPVPDRAGEPYRRSAQCARVGGTGAGCQGKRYRRAARELASGPGGAPR